MIPRFEGNQYIPHIPPAVNSYLPKFQDPIPLIISVLWEAYHALRNDNTIVISHNSKENEITEEWFVRVQNIWYSRQECSLSSLHPVTQAPSTNPQSSSRGTPMIDFCMRTMSSSGFRYGVECKRLYQDNSTYIGHYITEGINRFVSGYYESNTVRSSMVGYVLTGTVPDIVSKINSRLASYHPLVPLTRNNQVSDPQYTSRHTRTSDQKEITLDHLFFDFT